jgi:hypothetical protein
MTSDTQFLGSVVKESLKLFEYYRNGPVEMAKLRPGFIFQACVDDVLDGNGVLSIESGLGDHCIPEMGLAIQLKTTTQKNPAKQLMFCRSSVKGRTPELQKILRIKDVTTRIEDLLINTGTYQFVLLYVNLTTSTHKQYLLHDENGLVGDWLNPENVCTPPKQTHFVIRADKLKVCS